MAKLNPQTPVMNQHTAHARANYKGIMAAVKVVNADTCFGRKTEREGLLRDYNEAYAAEYKACQSQFRIVG